jgi:hypothetical protein
LKSATVLPRLIAGVVISLSLALPAFALETFTDEAKAHQHCPKDIVVWLNLPTMIWHTPNAKSIELHYHDYDAEERAENGHQ